MALKRLAIIGAGTMGRGIAESAAVHGLEVDIIEIQPEQAERARTHIQNSLEKAIRRGKLSITEPSEVLDRLHWHLELNVLADAEFVIEAASEREDIKRGLFQQLDQICPATAVLASNTSSISITRLAAATKRPAQVIGMHFFNPVPIMQPIEIVRGLQTSDETLARTEELSRQLEKQPLPAHDSPGFVVNRVLLPMINEAVFALQEGLAEAATIDSLMKLGCNHPMGPLELADFVGLDVCLAVLRVLHNELGDPKYRPCPLLVRMVDAGLLGRKSGEGFFKY